MKQSFIAEAAMQWKHWWSRRNSQSGREKQDTRGGPPGQLFTSTCGFFFLNSWFGSSPFWPIRKTGLLTTYGINLISVTNSFPGAITSIYKTSFCENLAPSTFSIRTFLPPILTPTALCCSPVTLIYDWPVTGFYLCLFLWAPLGNNCLI